MIRKGLLNIILLFFISFFLFNIKISSYSNNKFNSDIINKLKNKNENDIIQGLIELRYYKDRDYILNSIDNVLPHINNKNIKIQIICINTIGLLFLKQPKNNYINKHKKINPVRYKKNKFYIKAAKKSIPYLIKKLDDNNMQIKAFSAESLGMIGSLSYQAVPKIINLLDIDNDFLKEYLIISLGNIGSRAKSAIPLLKKLQNCQNENIKWTAIEALKLILNK